MKFIHTADLHLGMALKSSSFSKEGLYQMRSREITSAFFTLCDRVEQDNIDLFFIVGDLFDHPRVSPRLVEQVIDRLTRLDTQIFIVIGNHDRFLSNKAYASIKRHPHIHFFNHEMNQVSLDKVDVYGFNTHDFNEETLKTINAERNQTKQNVLLLHGDVFNAKDDHYLTSVDTLKQLGFDYIALGHIHKHQFITKTIAYSGNLEPFDFSETGVKGFIEGALLPSTQPSFIKSASRSFVVKSITLTPESSLETLKESINAIDKSISTNDFVRIMLEGTISSQLDLSDHTLDSLKENFFHLEFKNNTTLDIDFKSLKKAYEDTIIAHLIENYETNPQDEESLRLALRALLDTEEGIR